MPISSRRHSVQPRCPASPSMVGPRAARAAACRHRQVQITGLARSRIQRWPPLWGGTNLGEPDREEDLQHRREWVLGADQIEQGLVIGTGDEATASGTCASDSWLRWGSASNAEDHTACPSHPLIPNPSAVHKHLSLSMGDDCVSQPIKPSDRGEGAGPVVLVHVRSQSR